MTFLTSSITIVLLLFWRGSILRGQQLHYKGANKLHLFVLPVHSMSNVPGSALDHFQLHYKKSWSIPSLHYPCNRFLEEKKISSPSHSNFNIMAQTKTQVAKVKHCTKHGIENPTQQKHKCASLPQHTDPASVYGNVLCGKAVWHFWVTCGRFGGGDGKGLGAGGVTEQAKAGKRRRPRPSPSLRTALAGDGELL